MEDTSVDEARSLIKSASRFVHLANSEHRQMVQEWTFYGTFGLDHPNTSNIFQSYLCAKETFVLTLPFTPISGPWRFGISE